MDNVKFNLILDKLLERTKEGKIQWKTTANQDTLLAVLHDSSISVNRGFDEFEVGEFYTFDFRNENGETDASISVLEKDSPPDEFKNVRKIYELAQENSFTNNKTVDRILEQLAA